MILKKYLLTIFLLIGVLSNLNAFDKITVKKIFYKDKKIEWKRFYSNNNRVNQHLHYDKDGNIDIKEDYKNGNLERIFLISHGKDVKWKLTKD